MEGHVGTIRARVMAALRNNKGFTRFTMGNKGMTLIELVFVITIIAILVVAFGISFQG